jgi:hypothetical protein
VDGSAAVPFRLLQRFERALAAHAPPSRLNLTMVIPDLGILRRSSIESEKVALHSFSRNNAEVVRGTEGSSKARRISGHALTRTYVSPLQSEGRGSSQATAITVPDPTGPLTLPSRLFRRYNAPIWIGSATHRGSFWS